MRSSLIRNDQFDWTVYASQFLAWSTFSMKKCFMLRIVKRWVFRATEFSGVKHNFYTFYSKVLII